MSPVLAGVSRPPWIGPPIFTIAAREGGPPRLAIYPVCLSGSDPRCANIASVRP